MNIWDAFRQAVGVALGDQRGFLASELKDTQNQKPDSKASRPKDKKNGSEDETSSSNADSADDVAPLSKCLSTPPGEDEEATH